ncbi:MAG TPA: hypothetical protein VJ724_13395 [Tahibacter sp.]|nr:hypothetical protein [Tahibacter sp.]
MTNEPQQCAVLNECPDLESIGREIGTRRMRSVGMAVRAVFSIVSMVGASSALAQGGPCLTSCDDGGWLPGWDITPPGGWDNGGFGGSDPCAGNWCDGGGGNDVPPDEGGATGTPVGPTVARIRDYPGNTSNATCNSDQSARQAHASYDVRQEQARRYPWILGTGSVVEVTYDDDSTEKWIISYPLLTDPLSPVPVPGSLSGCASA